MIPILIAQSELLDRPQTIYWHNAFDWRQGLNMPSMLEEFELWWVAVSIRLGLRTLRLYSLEKWGPLLIETWAISPTGSDIRPSRFPPSD